MAELVEQLRHHGLYVSSASKEIGLTVDSIMRIESTDGRLRVFAPSDSEFRRDPDGACRRIRRVLRDLGYPI